jgi:hypothetical protein
MDLADGMIGDACQNCAEIEFRIQPVELGRSDEAVDGRGTLAAAVRSRKEKVLPSQSTTARSARSAKG